MKNRNFGVLESENHTFFLFHVGEFPLLVVALAGPPQGSMSLNALSNTSLTQSRDFRGYIFEVA